MFCSECGKKNIDNAKFCVECGTAISTKVQDSAGSKVNLNINAKKDNLDNEAAEKLKLFHEEVKRIKEAGQLPFPLSNELKERQAATKIRNEEKEEWLKKNGSRFKAHADFEGISLEELKLVVTEMDANKSKSKSAVLVVLFFIIVAIVAYLAKAYLLLSFTLFGLLVYGAIMQHKTPPNPNIICPHCKTKGQVYTESITVKKGVSGGKATGAILTGGLSLLATGLSREETQTKARCENCGSIWNF